MGNCKCSRLPSGFGTDYLWFYRAKYPLAIVAKVLETLNPNITMAYDIVCAFEKIVTQSSLGARASVQGLKFVVPAFHGHTHNWQCQLHYHPQYVCGVGLKDFKTCERCFALSNGLVATTHFATPYHHQQAIEQHFMFQNHDKYTELLTFIYNNYRQALEIIDTNTPAILKACSELQIAEAHFEDYLQEECAYL